MVKTKSKNKVDASIIEYLMLDPDSETSATTIALGIGLHSAKDVSNRLTELHKKNIINKYKRGKKVFWSIENVNTNDNIELDLTVRNDTGVSDGDGGENEHDIIKNITAETSADTSTTAGMDEMANDINTNGQTEYNNNLNELLTKHLTATIDHLHKELNFLREELRFKNREINDFFVYHDYNNGVPLINKTHPSDQIPSNCISYVTCPSCRSWCTGDSNGHAATSPKTPTEPYVLTTTATDAAESPIVRNHETPFYESSWSPVISKKGHNNSPSKLHNNKPPNPPSFINQNRFAALSIDTDIDDIDSVTDALSHEPTSNPASPKIATPVIASQRSSIYVNNHPENERFVSKTKHTDRKKPRIAIIGDSMVKNISSYKIRSIVNNIDCYVRPNLGAEVEDMMDKLRPDIKKRKTDIVVLHVGVNDCRNDNYCLRDTIFKYGLLLDWLESEGVIAIVSLNIFTDNHLINNRVRNINRELVDLCIRKNVNYISNTNITRDYLYERGNHLNPSGRDLLCDNICGFLNFVIPYVYPN